MEETISLEDIITILKKYIKIILATTFGFWAIAAIVSFFLLTPIYQATSQVLVNQKKEDMAQQMTLSDIQLNIQLINTYYEVIKSPAILNIVIQDLDLTLTAGQLAQKITVNSANNSQILNIGVLDESHPIAVELANQIVKVFKEEVPHLMNVNNVNILALAEPSNNPSPIKPNKMLNMAIGIVLGLMVGVGIAFLLQYLDKTVKTEQDIEDLLGLPVIGLVSPIVLQDENKSDVLPPRRNRQAMKKRR